MGIFKILKIVNNNNNNKVKNNIKGYKLNHINGTIFKKRYF